MVSLFGKWILRFFVFFAFINSSYAHAAAQEGNAFPGKTYAAFSVGYGSFQDSSQGTGQTPVARIGIGSLWQVYENLLLGAEIGAQSGNHMQLSNNVAAAFGYTSALPVFLTVKLPVDILAVLKFHFNSPAFVQVKAGAVYLRTMTDTTFIPSESQWLAEFQAGAGLDLTCRTRLALSYQQFFGQSPSLRNVNPVAGTANLSHVPTWQAGMISFETDF